MLSEVKKKVEVEDRRELGYNGMAEVMAWGEAL